MYNKKLNDRSLVLGSILIIFILCLIFNMNIELTGFKDDGDLFLKPLINQFDGNYLKFLVHRYNTWSSRVIIELFTLFGVTHPFFWKIFNSLAMLIAAVAPPYLIKKRKDVTVIDVSLTASLFATFPVTFFSETGWVATSTNYLWVYSFGLVAIYPLICHTRREKTPKWVYYLGLLATVYAANQEQMALLLLAFTVILAFINLKSNNSVKPLISNLVVNILSIIFVFTAKGNDIRFNQEVKNWFPDFENLSLLKKIELGYSSTLRHLFFDYQITILLFLFMISIFCISRMIYMKKFSVIGIFGILPLILSLIFSLNGTHKEGKILDILNMFNQYGTSINFDNPKTWIPDLLLTIILFSLLLSVIYLMDYQNLVYLPLLFICAAIVSRLIMGFSPTIWASATRTYLFTYGLFSITFMFLYTRVKIHNLSKYFVLAMSILLGLITYFQSFSLI